ncbi:hypothetical protein ACWD1Y_45135 [Streptomyces sp. NPDC002814]
MILAVICTACLMAGPDLTGMNLALPSAQETLGFTDADRQWIVTAYALPFGGLPLFFGRLSGLICFTRGNRAGRGHPRAHCRSGNRITHIPVEDVVKADDGGIVGARLADGRPVGRRFASGTTGVLGGWVVTKATGLTARPTPYPRPARRPPPTSTPC